MPVPFFKHVFISSFANILNMMWISEGTEFWVFSYSWLHLLHLLHLLSHYYAKQRCNGGSSRGRSTSSRLGGWVKAITFALFACSSSIAREYLLHVPFLPSFPLACLPVWNSKCAVVVVYFVIPFLLAYTRQNFHVDFRVFLGAIM